METRVAKYTLNLFLGVLVALASVFCPYVRAQTVNGSFHGLVTDPTGAAVPGASIVVTSLSNGQIRQTTTDIQGFYTIVDERPGHYSMTVSKSGFSTMKQSDVELLVNQNLAVNFQLQVGRISQQVSVVAANVAIDTTSATMGQVIDSRQVDDLPLNGRQFTELILLSPGAAPKETGQQTGQIVSIGGGGISPSMNGQRGTENMYYLDGIVNNQFFTEGWNISPPPDAIQEFNAQYHTVDARFGMSSGANINVVTKSGGAHIHGDVWEFLRNDDLDAAGFFANLSGSPKPPYKQNQFGGTIGGPVVFPGYDGRNKHTYFFGYYEGFRAPQSSTQFANVPTPQEESGNFSDLLTTSPVTGANGQALTDALGRPMLQGTIYNPYSSRQVTAGEVDPTTGLVAQSTGLVRDAFTGNMIPSSLITPTAAVYLNAFYPAPNYGPGGNTFPNYVTAAAAETIANSFGGGLDHTFANNDTLLGKFYFAQVDDKEANTLKLGRTESHNNGRTAMLGYTHLFSPTFLMTAHYAYIWSWFGSPTDPAGVGLLDQLNAQYVLPPIDNQPQVPQITLGPRLSSTSQFGNALGPMRSHQFNLDIQKVHGSHILSTGLLYMHTHSFTNGWGAGYYFDQFASSGISLAGSNQGSTGDGLASMLMDLPSSLQLFYGNTAAESRQNFIGGYVQDKWQTSRKLTVTVGLRWDFMSPPHYAQGQYSMWNTNCPMGNNQNLSEDQINSITEGCLLMPLPYVVTPTAADPDPPSWRTANARPNVWDPRYGGFQPRFGIAYALRKGTVIRAGFTAFDDHNDFEQLTQDGRGSWPWGGIYEPNDLNRGIPTTFWDNLPATTPLIGTPPVVVGIAQNPAAKIPYVGEFNFGIEQQITRSMALYVDYVGSQGRHQFGSWNYNSPLPSEMGPNAFPNGQPFPFLPYTIQGDDDAFNNDYNALQVKVEKRATNGLAFLGSYTWSKCMDDVEGMWENYPQDSYNFRGDEGPCDFNFPQMFSFNTVYQLPWGSGRSFAGNVGPVVNALIGGWNLSNITSAYSGSPFSVTVPFDNANVGTTQRANEVPGCQLRPAGFVQSWQAWYNPACFVVPPQYTFGTTSRNFLRGPAALDFDMSLFKDFRLTESKKLQFRAEAFNIFNRVNLSPPGGSASGFFSSNLGGATGTNVDTPTFMQSYSAAPGRIIQFALKYYY